MKKIITASLILAFSLFPAQRGSRNQSASFNKGYFSISYNYYPSFTPALNSYIESFGLEKFEDRMFLYSAKLQSNINPAFGIGIEYSFGSDNTSGMVEKTDQNNNIVKLDRAVDISTGIWSLSVNYRKSLAGRMEFFGILKGGYGTVDIMLSQDSGDQTFGDMWDSYDPAGYLDNHNRSSVYSSGLFAFSAENGAKVFVSSRIAVGVTFGYTYCFVNDSGELNYGFETIKNVPDMDFEGWNTGLSLYFGY